MTDSDSIRQIFVDLFDDLEPLVSYGSPTNWYRAEQVRRKLGFSTLRRVTLNLAYEDMSRIASDTPGGIQNCLYVSSSGVLRLVMLSDTPVTLAIREKMISIINQKTLSGEW